MESHLRAKDDGEKRNFVPFINASPAVPSLSIESGRVVGGLCEADFSAGLLPWRPDGRFRVFGGKSMDYPTENFEEPM